VRDDSLVPASIKLGTDAYVVVGSNSKCCEKEEKRECILEISMRQLIV